MFGCAVVPHALIHSSVSQLRRAACRAESGYAWVSRAMIVDRCVVVWRRAWQLHVLTPHFGGAFWRLARCDHICCGVGRLRLTVDLLRVSACDPTRWLDGGWMAVGWRLDGGWMAVGWMAVGWRMDGGWLLCACVLYVLYVRGAEPNAFCCVDGPDACHEE